MGEFSFLFYKKKQLNLYFLHLILLEQYTKSYGRKKGVKTQCKSEKIVN